MTRKTAIFAIFPGLPNRIVEKYVVWGYTNSLRRAPNIALRAKGSILNETKLLRVVHPAFFCDRTTK